MRTHSFTTLFTTVICAAIALSAAACDRSAAPASQPAKPFDQIHVLTTVYALADVVRQIGGDRVVPEWYIESGQSLADLTESPDRRQQFRSADLVVTRGMCDPWTLEGTGNAYQDRRILRVDTLPSAMDLDPTRYIWLDPQVILELSDDLTNRLAALDPQDEKLFRTNLARFRGEIVAACDTARPALDAGTLRFLTLDRGFAPLARRFGMTDVPLPDIQLSDPTPYGAKVLQKAARDAGVSGIFVNAENPMALLHDWERRLGLAVLPLDALGSSAPSGRSTYVAILRYNLEQLAAGTKKAPSTSPTSVPATTSGS